MSSQRADVWRIRLLQGMLSIALGAGVPFFSLYYKHVLVRADGAPALEYIGFALAIMPLLGAISAPLAGIIADRFKIENRLLTLCALGMAAGAVLMSVPSLVHSFALRQNAAFIIAGMSMLGLFFRPIVPLIDTETLEYVHASSGDRKEYGVFRSIQSATWILSCAGFGALIFLTEKIYLGILAYGAGFIVLAVIAITGMRTKIKPVRIPWDHLKKDVMFQRLLVYEFLQEAAVMSAFMYLGYYIDDLLKGSRTELLVVGLVYAAMALFEVPMMILSKKLICRIGNRNMILFGTGLEATRLALLMLTARFKSPALLIGVSLMHGIGYGMQFPGIINLIDRQTHPDIRATYLTIFAVVGLSLGAATGTALGTIIISKVGSVTFMGISAGLMALAAVYFAVFVKGHGPEKDDPVPADAASEP